MKKRYLLTAFFALVVVFSLSGLIRADFEYINNTLGTTYSGGEIIRGSVKISLEDEPANSEVTSNFLGNITLLNLLEKSGLSEGVEFNCSTFNCKRTYESNSKVNQFSLDGEKIIGFKIQGEEITEITSINLGIKSNIGPSCSGQLKVDVLGDGENLIVNNKYVNESCFARNFGCFESGESTQKAIIGSNELCEIIELPSAPAYEVGARIKNSTKGSGDLELSLYDEEGGFLGKCNPGEPEKNEGIVKCNIEHSSASQKKFLVCISSVEFDEIDQNPDYRINVESSGEVCGTDDIGSDNFNRDYEIYGRGLKFNSAEFQLNEDDFENNVGISLRDYAYDYILDNYEPSGSGVLCEPECIVPIKIIGSGQDISLNGAGITYRSGNTLLDSSGVYSLDEADLSISSGGVEIDLEKAEFTIPNVTTEKRFKLYIGDKIVFEKNIDVETSFNFDITPKFSLVGRETKFKVIYGENITSSTWKFGNDSSVKVSGGEIKHSIKDVGEIPIEVYVETENKTSRKTFRVVVGDPKSSANVTIKDYEKRINNITKSLSQYPGWVKDEIKERINISSLNFTLNDLREKFDSASTDEEYLEVVNTLLEMNIPYSIATTNKGILPIDIGLVNIDPFYLEDVSTEKVEDGDAVRNAIMKWNQDNYDIVIDYEEISAIGSGDLESILGRYRISINTEEQTPAYFFIDYPRDSIRFRENYDPKNAGGGSGTYIYLSNPSSYQDIEFILPQFVEVEELGAYLSPVLDDLEIDQGEILPPGDEVKFRWGLFTFWMIVLLVVTLAIYVTLQEWYKRKYESYLFKNKDSLFNVINFIYNGRASGLGDKEIRKKLSGSGWKGEQITYAFRKIDGKRTGMWEIPIFKFFENRKVKEEIERRHQGTIDARFIKRNRY